MKGKNRSQAKLPKRSKMDTEKPEKREKVLSIVRKYFGGLSEQEVAAWTDMLINRANKVADFQTQRERNSHMDSSIEGAMIFGKIRQEISVSALTLEVLSALNLHLEQPTGVVQVSNFLGHDTAAKAFEAKYEQHGGEKAFLDHLYQQRKEFKNLSSKKFPFFALLQSSGYGKSRLVTNLMKPSESVKKQLGEETPLPRIIYFSFAVSEAYPKPNVIVDTQLEQQPRRIVTNAFFRLFREALLERSPAGNSQYHLHNKSGLGHLQNEPTIKEEDCVLFVLDEASQLLTKQTADQVNFFRCFRSATTDFVVNYPQCFFVTLSTSSAVSQTMPGIRHDPSFKIWADPNDYREPMTPFLLHEAIGLRNDETIILGLSVENCHKPQKLLGMGRPMWRAFLDTAESSEDGGECSTLVDFALAKLIGQTPVPQVEDLSPEQSLALLSCRACLTISPVSWVSRALVGGHMATAVKVSSDREEIMISYPSEPALALAARKYAKQTWEQFWIHSFVQLKSYFASGAVSKGHRGEVIVRLLNLIAIDKCMERGYHYMVQEVKFMDFLKQFDREGAQLSSILDKERLKDDALSENQAKVLKREGILESAESALKHSNDIPVETKWNGYVCFTHFIYLSKSKGTAMITPNLLAYAYRRTAAIAVDDGRRGIDWIIPVRVENQFVGYCGQDKNRMRDTLPALTELSNDETHHTMTAEYFLTHDEKQLFLKKKWSLDWPAVLFSIDAKEEGVALAERAVRKRLRSRGDVVQDPFPCIVLTGLGYDTMMGKEANLKLRELKDFIVAVPKVYENSVPLTYGSKVDVKADDDGTESMELDDL